MLSVQAAVRPESIGEHQRVSVIQLPPLCILPRCGLALTGHLPQGSRRMEGESKPQLTQRGQAFKVSSCARAWIN